MKIREAIERASDPKRKKLRLNGRGMRELPLEVTELTHLEVLEVYGNRLRTLPAEVGRMVNLRELDVSENELVDLGPGFGSLRSLEVLNISSNEQLKQLPASIGQLKNFMAILAYDVGLTQLPGELALCTSLEQATLNCNPFDQFPQVLLELKELSLLNLAGCPINFPPDIGNHLHKLGTFHCNNEIDIQVRPPRTPIRLVL